MKQSTFALIRADLWRAKRFLAVGHPEKMTVRDVVGLYWHLPPMGAITLFRIANGLYRKRLGVLGKLVWNFVHFWYGLEMKLDMPVGGGLFIAHCQGCVIYARQIGQNATFFHAPTLGMRNEYAFPTIGNDVYVGAGARILGGVVVGDGAKIGANAVVIHDVPPGATAIGVPARVIPARQESAEDPGTPTDLEMSGTVQ